MSEERFDRLEKMIGDTQNQVSQMQIMMEQLIKMAGHNNAATEELHDRMDKLETKFDKLENRADNLESQMQTGFSGLTAMVNLLGEKVDAIPRFESKLEIFNDYLLNQAADIRMLKKAR
jgi:DNA repair ATPase RecN